MEKVLIIGGSNIDYFGKSVNKIINNDSNIGKIEISFGGVARNICENLARLKANVTFITAIGNDESGKSLKNELLSLEVKVITPKTKLSSSSYMAIHDNDGDMVLALCDDLIINEVNEEFLVEYDNLIKDFNYIVLDSNLTQATINYLVNKYQDKKIIVDGISTSKIIKFSEVLDKIYLLKCNIYEAQTLVNKKLTNVDLVKELGLLGLKRVVLTQGENDIFYLTNNVIFKTPVIKVDKIVNATGAGDAMLAGITYALLIGKNLNEAVEYGKKQSALTLQTVDAVYKG